MALFTRHHLEKAGFHGLWHSTSEGLSTGWCFILIVVFDILCLSFILHWSEAHLASNRVPGRLLSKEETKSIFQEVAIYQKKC